MCIRHKATFPRHADVNVLEILSTSNHFIENRANEPVCCEQFLCLMEVDILKVNWTLCLRLFSDHIGNINMIKMGYFINYESLIFVTKIVFLTTLACFFISLIFMMTDNNVQFYKPRKFSLGFFAFFLVLTKPWLFLQKLTLKKELPCPEDLRPAKHKGEN